MSFQKISTTGCQYDTCGCYINVRNIHTYEINPETGDADLIDQVTEPFAFFKQCEFHITPQQAYDDNLKKNAVFEEQEAVIAAELGDLIYITQEIRVKEGTREVLREVDVTDANRGLAKGVRLELTRGEEPKYVLFGHTEEELATLEKYDFGDRVVKKEDGSLLSIKEEIIKEGILTPVEEEVIKGG